MTKYVGSCHCKAVQFEVAAEERLDPYFRCDCSLCSRKGAVMGEAARTALAWAYFNPLWIARHLVFVKIFSGAWSDVSWALLTTASYSFLGSIPISLVGNFIIQNRLPERHRFLGSAIFSGLTAVYYALSAVWFA